jgi:hypothetical protein
MKEGRQVAISHAALVLAFPPHAMQKLRVGPGYLQ